MNLIDFLCSRSFSSLITVAIMTTGTEIDTIQEPCRRGPQNTTLALIVNPTGDSRILRKDFQCQALCLPIDPTASDCFDDLTHVLNTI